MLDLAAEIESAADRILERWSRPPRVGIILGTGLGSFCEGISVEADLSFADIPAFPDSTSIGHEGRLVCGRLCDVPVVTMQGRIHCYEGHSHQVATLPIRVMKRLGIELLIVSNASGGLNPLFQSGDVMVIEDQINLMWQNPLIGINDGRLGPRYPDMCQPYDPLLVERAITAGNAGGFACHRGVYAAMTGPSYETRAEYRMLRRIGADVVGMSTVPETIVAVHAGLPVLGLSAVTNLCRPDTLESTSGWAVSTAAERAEPKIRHVIMTIVSQLA